MDIYIILIFNYKINYNKINIVFRIIEKEKYKKEKRFLIEKTDFRAFVKAGKNEVG